MDPAEHDGFVVTGTVEIVFGLDGAGEPAWRINSDDVDDLMFLGALDVLAHRTRERAASRVFDLDDDDDFGD